MPCPATGGRRSRGVPAPRRRGLEARRGRPSRPHAALHLPRDPCGGGRRRARAAAEEELPQHVFVDCREEVGETGEREAHLGGAWAAPKNADTPLCRGTDGCFQQSGLPDPGLALGDEDRRISGYRLEEFADDEELGVAADESFGCQSRRLGIVLCSPPTHPPRPSGGRGVPLRLEAPSLPFFSSPSPATLSRDRDRL